MAIRVSMYPIVVQGKDVRTVMAIPGWSSYDLIESYLAQATEQWVGEPMGEVGADAGQ